MVQGLKQSDSSGNGAMLNVISGTYYDQAAMTNIDFNTWIKIYSNGSPTKPIELNGKQVLESEYKDQEWTHKTIIFDSGINGFYSVDFSYNNISQKTKYETIFDQTLSTFKFL